MYNFTKINQRVLQTFFFLCFAALSAPRCPTASCFWLAVFLVCVPPRPFSRSPARRGRRAQVAAASVALPRRLCALGPLTAAFGHPIPVDVVSDPGPLRPVTLQPPARFPGTHPLSCTPRDVVPCLAFCNCHRIGAQLTLVANTGV